MQSTETPEVEAPAKRTNRNALVAIPVVIALALGSVLVFLVAAGSGEDTATPVAAPSATASAAPTPAASPAVAPSKDLSAVTVTGTDSPAIKAPFPFGVESTLTKVVTKGKGKVIADGQRITIDYLGVNGKDGKTFDTSYGKPEPINFILGDENLIKGMMTGLTGATVGSRVLVAIPAKDGYGTAGAPDAGIGGTDTLLFVIDVKAATTPPKPLAKATGTAVAPKAGLPTVTLDGTGKPAITVPKTAAPAALVVQPLINGTGPTVAKGQTITVHYTGVIWASGKEFDSSWTSGTPATFPIGTGGVIPGWDKGLVGKKVGSQVLLVIPPAEGYGAAGAPNAGIGATDTLVFVVDILAAS